MGFFKRRFIAVFVVALAVATLGGIGGVLYFGVFSPHRQVVLDTFNDTYGTAGTRLDACKTCHTTGRAMNLYGSQQKSEFSRLENPGAEDLTEAQWLEVFRAVLVGIEELDSDNDGYSNIAEISARTFPGDPGDHPVTDK